MKNWSEAKKVLIFSPKGVLIALCASVNKAANFGHCHPGNMSKVCLGQLETLGGYYLRYTSPLYNLSLEDIGTLKLEDYDKATNFQHKDFFQRSKTRILQRWHNYKRKGNNVI